MNSCMGTNASLSLLLLQPVCCLCCLLQARLHVAARQPGHLYFDATVLQMLHRCPGGAPGDSTATGDTICRCCSGDDLYSHCMRTRATYVRELVRCVCCTPDICKHLAADLFMISRGSKWQQLCCNSQHPVRSDRPASCRTSKSTLWIGKRRPFHTPRTLRQVCLQQTLLLESSCQAGTSCC